MGVWDYSLTDDRLDWDERMFELFDVDQRTFRHTFADWQDSVLPAALPQALEDFQAALKGEKEFVIEFPIHCRDGSIRYLAGAGIVTRNKQGEPIRVVGINFDITRRKQTEIALQDSEANFRAFFETLTDMIFVATPDGRIIFTNTAVSQTLGYSPAELTTMHILEMHSVGSRPEAGEIFAAMLQNERDCCPLPVMRKDGSLVPVETRVWLGRWNGADCVFGISKTLSAEQEAQQRFERLFRNNPAVMALSTLRNGALPMSTMPSLKPWAIPEPRSLVKPPPNWG
jgi:PAS domain S-box-containing protein